MANITNMMLNGVSGGVTSTSPTKMTTPAQPTAFSQANITLPGPVTDTAAKSWFEAMAKAWGKVLDEQAHEITTLSSEIGESSGSGNGGNDQPSSVTLLTAASLKFQFLSTNAATSNNAVGQGLDTLARKQ